MLTLVQQRGNTRVTVHSPLGVIGIPPTSQTSWFQQQLAGGEKSELRGALVQLSRTVTEIHLQNRNGVYHGTK